MTYFLKNKLYAVYIGFPLLLTMFSLQSCSKAQIGEELSKSFDQPQIESSKDLTKDNPSNKQKINKTRKKLKSIKKKPLEEDLKESRNAFEIRKKNEIPRPRKNITFKPSPYRITIKLSEANPSSPAESVTRALIGAGVRFEVEKIERIQSKNQFRNIPQR